MDITRKGKKEAISFREKKRGLKRKVRRRERGWGREEIGTERTA